jgi:hypothetical protein
MSLIGMAVGQGSGSPGGYHTVDAFGLFMRV